MCTYVAHREEGTAEGNMHLKKEAAVAGSQHQKLREGTSEKRHDNGDWSSKVCDLDFFWGDNQC